VLGDSAAAASLFERTVALLSVDDPQRLEFLIELAHSFREVGQLEEAESALREAAETGTSMGLESVAQRAALDRAFLRWYTNPSEGTESVLGAALTAVPLFERIGDGVGLAQTWWLIAEVYWMRLELVRMQDALERALEADRGAVTRLRASTQMALARAAMYGPMPVADALRLCGELATQTDDDRTLAAMLDAHTAYLEAIGGRLEDARSRIAAAGSVLEEVGGQMLVASAHRVHAGQIELLAGDAAAAEAYFRDGYEMLETFGEHGNLAGLAVYLAEALHRLGRNEEADSLVDQAARGGNPDDAELQILWRLSRARIRASAGDLSEAERLAREAVALAGRTDATSMRGDALLTLADVLASAGANGDAREAARAALELYEAKGNGVGAREARDRLGLEVSAG
jgi:tetratricopeptide (TPR) repeat protein